MLDLEAILQAHDGLLVTRQHRPLASTLSRWVRAGRLVELVPGVLAAPGSVDDPMARIRAVALWAPSGTFCGDAAARLTLWPAHEVDQIEVALSTTRRRVPPGVRLTQRQLQPELVVDQDGFRVTTPVLTAVDLADRDGGELIDDLLRRKKAPVESFAAVLAACPHRAGNSARRRVVVRSRTKPWSRAEREYHDLLDRHRVVGWVANKRVELEGVEYWLDIAFERERLAVEVDGFDHHSSWQAFQDDRRRQNHLVAHGWRVLRFTWVMLDEPEYVIATIRAALARPR